jgi:predicted transcriptional regulator YdeE
MRYLKENLKVVTPQNNMRSPAIVVVALSGLALISLCQAQSSTAKIVHGDEFSIIGIVARTSGEQEMYGDGQIAGLWQKFYQEHILEQIPNKAEKNIYAVYTDYSGDRLGAYTVLIGARVKDKTQAPAGMVLKTIPAGRYAVLTSEKGAAETVLPAAWQRVWALEDKDELGGKRAYKSDYEVYGSGNTDPQNTQADLYIGLRSSQK